MKEYLSHTKDILSVTDERVPSHPEDIISDVCENSVKGSKHIKGSEERFLLGQKHNLQIFGVFPFVKLHNWQVLSHLAGTGDVSGLPADFCFVRIVRIASHPKDSLSATEERVYLHTQKIHYQRQMKEDTFTSKRYIVSDRWKSIPSHPKDTLSATEERVYLHTRKMHLWCQMSDNVSAIIPTKRYLSSSRCENTCWPVSTRKIYTRREIRKYQKMLFQS